VGRDTIWKNNKESALIHLALIKTHNENHNVRTFYFKPERPIHYTSGQFIEMYLPHERPDERGEKHWFTLTSSPTEKLLSITTKYAAKKASTFKKALFGLKPSDVVKIVEPMGDFVLPKDASIPLVFVAGGIGVTPFHSMAKWLTDTGEKRQIQVLLAANKPQDVLFEKLFSDYGAQVTVIVSEPAPNWKGQVGRLSAEKIFEIIDKSNSKRIYVSGPEPMVEALEQDLQKHGIKKSQLVLDFFPGYTADLK